VEDESTVRINIYTHTHICIYTVFRVSTEDFSAARDGKTYRLSLDIPLEYIYARIYTYIVRVFFFRRIKFIFDRSPPTVT